MTAILGISAFYHDSAAAIVVDGTIVAAAQEERFTRKKHDASFPLHAIKYCLAEAGIETQDLDHVGFYEKPLLKFDRLLETYLAYAPRGLRSFVKAMPQWAGEKLHLRREIRRGLGGKYSGRIVFCEHHESHAASAFYPSPFEEAAILTMDGVGEWTTTSLGVGCGNKFQLTDEIRFPHSIGLLYSAFTYFSGFRVNSGEYKLMGLAPYGDPKYADVIRQNLIDIRDDGSFRLNMEFFNYCQGLTMTSSRFHQLFGRQPRTPESPIEQLDMDLAASIQVVTEEVVMKTGQHLHQQTKLDNLVMAGGVALNCVANGKLLRDGPFKNIWIQPAAGDAGGALGVALLIWYQLMDNQRELMQPDHQHGSLLGPAFDATEIETTLSRLGAVYERLKKPALLERVAEDIAAGKVVGWMQGRMEFGPRALGSRSILGDPRNPEMQSKMNLKIKFRESFRPFAPSVLQEHCHENFDMPDESISPYMLLVFDVDEDRRIDVSEEGTGLERVRNIRSEIPAITHVDHTARVQTVDGDHHESYRDLLQAFYEVTGCPIVINTSFNVRGEPIVCTPEDAYRCFMATDMDALVIEDYVLSKESQPSVNSQTDKHLSRFEWD